MSHKLDSNYIESIRYLLHTQLILILIYLETAARITLRRAALRPDSKFEAHATGSEVEKIDS